MTTQTATTPALATRSMDDSTPDTVLVGVTAQQIDGLAQGDYQQRLLDGAARWSGSDLSGSAKNYAGKYASSRKTLLARLAQAGYSLGWAKTTTGRLVLVVSAA